MYTIFLASGVASIQQQNMNGPPYIEITGFKLGDRTASLDQMSAWDLVEDPLATMQGNLVLSSDQTYIYYTPDTQDLVKLTCYVSEAIAQIPIGNVTLYATFGGVERALCFSATDSDFIKLQASNGSPNGSPGFEFYFDLMLSVPNLLERFDFSNLTLRVPEFLTVVDEQALPHAAFDGHDDFFINNHTLAQRPSMIVNKGNFHFGLQRMVPLAPGAQVGARGGSSGDGYVG